MKRCSFWRLLCVSLVIWGLLAACSKQDEGEKAFRNGDFAKALKAFSAKDTPKNSYYLALMYYKGYGVPKDSAIAAQLFLKAAEQGYAAAQFEIGSMYANGRGVPLDKQAALGWYMKAAAQGNAMAQFNIGLMYFYGDGVKADREQAISWIRKAADQGNQHAKAALQSLRAN
jgi:hypothetical protein